MFWNKKRKCQHDWHYVGDSSILLNNIVDAELIEACRIFCPKCTSEKTVRPTEWAIMIEKQAVLNEHLALTDF